MLAPSTNELLVRASCAEALADVANDVLPDMGQRTHSALVFLYDASPESVRVYGPSGAAEMVAAYFRDYASGCPLHHVKSHVDGKLLPTTRLVADAGYARSPSYREFFEPLGFDHHLVARLLAPSAANGHHEVGIILNRGRRQGEFTPAEVADMDALVPSLTSAVRRAREIDAARRCIVTLEAVLLALAEGTTKLVFDATGALVHVQSSPGTRSDVLVALVRDPCHPVVRSARALASRADPSAPLGLSHVITTPGGTVYRVELSRTDALFAGGPMVIASFVPLSSGTPAWREWRLSPAESTVLGELVVGGTNAEIGARLFLSPETVRTHLTRIFRKMNVRSRLDAAVLATRPSRAREDG